MDEFDVVYRQFQPKVMRYLTQLLGEADAQDVSQGVMLRISHGLSEFRGDSALSTWIYRIATNAARDHLRTRRQATEPFHERPDAQGSGQDMAQNHIREEMGNCVQELVNQLPQGYRLVLLLSDYEELSNPEIAAILDLSLETVKIRLHRARTRMRQIMECECHFYRHSEIGLMCDRREK